jgi:tryptophan-rich sensory protein
MTLKLLVYGWAVLSGYLVWKAPEFEDKVAVGAALFIVLLFLIVLATSHN